MATRLWVVVPCKPFGEAKQRLAGLLAPSARAELSVWLLRRTLRTAQALPEIAGCIVVSRDEAALAQAATAGAIALAESGRHLNAALRQATAVAMAHGADSVLVLPIDLPLLETRDLAALVAAAPAPPSVVIAAAERDGGTNALLLSPPTVIAPAFGRGSRRQHEDRARSAGATVATYRCPPLALDLDTPADLQRVAATLPPPLRWRSSA